VRGARFPNPICLSARRKRKQNAGCRWREIDIRHACFL